MMYSNQSKENNETPKFPHTNVLKFYNTSFSFREKKIKHKHNSIIVTVVSHYRWFFLKFALTIEEEGSFYEAMKNLDVTSPPPLFKLKILCADRHTGDTLGKEKKKKKPYILNAL